jgi:hypothetical protein
LERLLLGYLLAGGGLSSQFCHELVWVFGETNPELTPAVAAIRVWLKLVGVALETSE